MLRNGSLAMSTILYPIIIWLIRVYKSIKTKLVRLSDYRVEKFVNSKLKEAGIVVNGPNRWDPQTKNKEFYIRLACDSTLGIGEAYMDGHWECEALDEFICKVFGNKLYENYLYSHNFLITYISTQFFNLQTAARAWEVGEQHYDLGNDLFEAMLDPSMNYSCGYWKNATNLNQAQQNKMELIAQKLMLKPGMRVLDIGCGWGGLCKYLAENHKVQVVGCTISAEQAKYAQEVCAGFPVDVRLVDYRDINEKFDRIVSVGMFEHVGRANYRTFFEVTHKCLEEDGLFLLHTIGVNHPRIPLSEMWMNTYIFPNGVLPYHQDIPKNTDGLYTMEDWHNFGYDYSKTLMAWHDNFIKAWPKTLSYKGERFFRMWKYYLLQCAGVFRCRKFQVWQVVLSKNGVKGGYQAPR